MATVLIVDDRAANREVARAALDHGGHHVIEATEGHQALAMAHTIHPDVILTDVVMPGMDGYELAHALHADADTADIPVLFYTANYSPAEAQPMATACGSPKFWRSPPTRSNCSPPSSTLSTTIPRPRFPQPATA